MGNRCCVRRENGLEECPLTTPFRSFRQIDDLPESGLAALRRSWPKAERLQTTDCCHAAYLALLLTMRKFKASFLLFAFLVVACGSSEPQPETLPVSEGVDYQVSIKTFDDGAYADQPFHLLVRTKDRGSQSRTVLRAEQCKDVAVAHTQDILYIFYDELVLDAFSSFQYEKDEPRIMLCDMHLPICVHIQTELTASGTQLSEVCTYQTS